MFDQEEFEEDLLYDDGDEEYLPYDYEKKQFQNAQKQQHSGSCCFILLAPLGLSLSLFALHFLRVL